MAKKKQNKDVPKDGKMSVANKILMGFLLSPEEWEIAKDCGYFKCPKDTPYENLRMGHYEDDKKRGYLCIKDGKISSEVIEKSGNTTTYCMWGIHREDIDPKKLRDNQKWMW